MAILEEIHQSSITNICFEITYLKFIKIYQKADHLDSPMCDAILFLHDNEWKVPQFSWYIPKIEAKQSDIERGWSLWIWVIMMTSSNGSIFHVTGPLWGESTSHQWIPFTNASDAELWCFRWSPPEQTVEQTLETLVIWDAIALIMRSLQWLNCAKTTQSTAKWEADNVHNSWFVLQLLSGNFIHNYRVSDLEYNFKIYHYLRWTTMYHHTLKVNSPPPRQNPAISQTIFSDAFPWTKSFIFW